MIDKKLALQLVKQRMNRMQEDTSLDGYIKARIDATVEELENTGIRLNESTADLMLIVDWTVWEYQNRDKETGVPEHLRLRRRERWLQENAT